MVSAAHLLLDSPLTLLVDQTIVGMGNHPSVRKNVPRILAENDTPLCGFPPIPPTMCFLGDTLFFLPP